MTTIEKHGVQWLVRLTVDAIAPQLHCPPRNTSVSVSEGWTTSSSNTKVLDNADGENGLQRSDNPKNEPDGVWVCLLQPRSLCRLTITLRSYSTVPKPILISSPPTLISSKLGSIQVLSLL